MGILSLSNINLISSVPFWDCFVGVLVSFYHYYVLSTGLLKDPSSQKKSSHRFITHISVYNAEVILFIILIYVIFSNSAHRTAFRQVFNLRFHRYLLMKSKFHM